MLNSIELSDEYWDRNCLLYSGWGVQKTLCTLTFLMEEGVNTN